MLVVVVLVEVVVLSLDIVSIGSTEISKLRARNHKQLKLMLIKLKNIFS